MNMQRSRWPIVVVGAVVVLLAAACAPAGPKAATEVSFTARDYSFEGPDSVASGWTKFTVVGAGQEFHHIQLVQLDAGKTVADLVAALTAQPVGYPDWANPDGGPNTAGPAGTASAIVFLDAGSYALICIIPGADGVPHFQKGMAKALTVTSEASAAVEPAGDVTISQTDFHFDVSGSLTPGTHTLRIENAGGQQHEAVLVKLAEGVTAEEYLNAAPDSTPPLGVHVGGITGILPSERNFVSIDLESGNYALYCFLTDPASGAPHFVLGMMQEFTVP
jgi:hypothetical protein